VLTPNSLLQFGTRTAAQECARDQGQWLFATSGTQPGAFVTFTPTLNPFRKSTEMSRVLHTCISYVLIDTFTRRKDAILGKLAIIIDLCHDTPTNLIRGLPPLASCNSINFSGAIRAACDEMEPRHTEWEFRRGAGAIARTLMGIRGRTTGKNTPGERPTGSIEPAKLSASLISPFFRGSEHSGLARSSALLGIWTFSALPALHRLPCA
jgi:hypothetical protein